MIAQLRNTHRKTVLYGVHCSLSRRAHETSLCDGYTSQAHSDQTSIPGKHSRYGGEGVAQEHDIGVNEAGFDGLNFKGSQ